MTNNTNRANFDRYEDINLVNRYGDYEAGIHVIPEEDLILVWDEGCLEERRLAEYPAALREMKALYSEYLEEAEDDESAAVIAENLDTLDRAIAELAE